MRRLYYRIKWSLWPYFKYFRIVGKMRPWDYMYIIKMLRFQLSILEREIRVNDNHVDSRADSEEIRRVCAYMDAHIEDNYADRCGFDNNFDMMLTDVGNNLCEVTTNETEEQRKNNTESIQWSIDLENKEWGEMIDLLKNMRNWWD